MKRRYKMCTLLPLFLAGLLACGCEQIILQDLVRESLIAGLKEEIQSIPGLLLNLEDRIDPLPNLGNG